jgi:hypothetical protein
MNGLPRRSLSHEWIKDHVNSTNLINWYQCPSSRYDSGVQMFSSLIEAASIFLCRSSPTVPPIEKKLEVYLVRPSVLYMMHVKAAVIGRNEGCRRNDRSVRCCKWAPIDRRRCYMLFLGISLSTAKIRVNFKISVPTVSARWQVFCR